MAQRILGLDLGPAAVRAAVIESSYRGFTLAGAAALPVPPEGEGAAPLRARQLEAVRALLAGPGLQFDTALVALPGVCASHAVTLPFTDPRRIEQTIGFEVEGQIPFDLAEAAWDWQPLRVAGGQTELLVAVVRREELAGLLADLAAAGVDPRAVVPPAPALASLAAVLPPPLAPEAAEGALEAPAADAGPGADALLDLDAGRASLCVLGPGGCEVARTFPVAARADAAATAAVARDVRATLRAWRARAGAAALPLRRLFLLREAAALPGLAEALEGEASLPAAPLALTGPALAAVSPEELGPCALALALALRGADLGRQAGRAPRLNLRRGDLAYTRDFEHLRGRIARLAGWAAAVVLLAVLSAGVRAFTLADQERLLTRALCDATQKLAGKCIENDELALATLRGKGTAAASIPKSSALDVFTELSNRTPQDTFLRYDRVEITRDKLHLQGVTDAAEQVDRIVSGLKASRCFTDAASGYVRKRGSDGKFEFTIDADVTCDGPGEQPGGRS